MVVKRKTGRPRKRKIVKKDKSVELKQEGAMVAKEESHENPFQSKKSDKIDFFPDRKPIYGGDEYIAADATELTKDGKPWIPEEHGYVSRLMSPEQIKIQGMRGYTPVPVEAGIRFKQHPLFTQEITTENMGKGIYLHAKDNEEMNKELAQITGGSSKFVKLNSSMLCLAPLEVAQGRRKFAKDVSNSGLKKDLMKADEEAQEEFGNPAKFGKFSIGRNAERLKVDRRTRSTKKVWSVPAKIS